MARKTRRQKQKKQAAGNAWSAIKKFLAAHRWPLIRYAGAFGVLILFLVAVIGTPDRDDTGTGPDAPRESVSQEDPLPALEETVVGRPAWQQFAVPSTPDPDKAMIAVVIDDLGISADLTRRAIGLESPMTMSFLPYGYGLEEHVAQARKRGHEIMLHLPMSAAARSADPGPHALSLGMKDDELRHHIDWNLLRFSGYVGINNHMGSAFTADSRAMQTVLQEVKTRGLLYLDSRTTAETVAKRLADRMGIPNTERDVFIDEEESSTGIRSNLARLEETALEQGFAVAIGHPRALTLNEIERWLKRLDRNRYQLVPVSTVVAQKEAQWRRAGGAAGR